MPLKNTWVAGESYTAADQNAVATDVNTNTTAVAGKEAAIAAGTTAQYWRGDKSWQTLDKAAAGLGNVDNTSNATERAATATLTNKTLTSPKIDTVKDTNGNTAIEVGAAASAVNYLRVENSASGSQFVGLYARGTDTDIHWNLYAKGTGNVTMLDDAGRIGFQVDNQPGAVVNYPYVTNSVSGVGPTLGAWGSDADIDLKLATRGNGVVRANGTELATISTSQAISGKTETLAAGSTSVAPLKFTSGTNLTTPAAGAVEYDGVTFSGTIDTTSGRGLNTMDQMFRLSADGAAIGATIADYFGTNSAFPYVASGVYEIVWYLIYTKNTGAGSVTYTITSTTAPTLLSAWYTQTPIAGVGTGTAQQAALVKSTSAGAALPATGSLAFGVNHQAEVHCIYQAGTAGNVRLSCTESASTITPLAGSFYRVRRLPSGNVGTFVA